MLKLNNFVTKIKIKKNIFSNVLINGTFERTFSDQPRTILLYLLNNKKLIKFKLLKRNSKDNFELNQSI